MKAVLYYIFTFLAWLISLLPLQVLHIFSYLLFFIFYYFPGYRKKIVLKNLNLSFPEKSEDEIKAISKRFYLHLSDLFVEGIKLRNMSSKELQRRFKYINPELMNSYCDSGQDAIAAFGHYGNWEWTSCMHKVVKYRVMMVYKPLHNKYFDKYFYNLRSRYGIDVVPMSSILRKILQYRKEGINTITGLIADQTPPRKESHFWTEFLNQDTPVYLGVEKIAAKYNMAVFFLKINKVKRGYYEVEAELLTDSPDKMDEFELTRMHMNKLEEEIREKPEYWLWSHRRWKYKRSANK